MLRELGQEIEWLENLKVSRHARLHSVSFRIGERPASLLLRFAEAEPIYEQVDELARRLLGEDHPTTLSIANDRANLYSSTGREEMAGTLYERVLKLRRQKLGDDNPATWDAMNNLAIFLAEQGQPDQALPLLEEVVERRTTVDGPDHPDTIMGLNNLAFAYQTMEEFERAINCYRNAISGAQQTLPDDHPQVITLKTNLGNALLKIDQPEAAEEAFREALAACQQRYGEASKEAASQLGRLAMTLHQQGKNDEAERIAQQQLAIRLEVHPDLWTTALSMSLLGKIQASLGKLDDAERNLLSGAETITDGWDNIPMPNQTSAQQALDWLVEYFEQQSDTARADQWRAIRALR